MEELMPELVGLVLSHVNPLGLMACHFVCTTWMTTCASSLHETLAKQRQHNSDYSKQC
jgi:hypothetical protein